MEKLPPVINAKKSAKQKASKLSRAWKVPVAKKGMQMDDQFFFLG